MPGVGSFRKTVFDPILIVAQIVGLQSSYYLTLTIIVLSLELLTGSNITLDHVISYKEVRTDTVLGWSLFLANLVNAGLSSIALRFIVQRSKLCLDFSGTLFFYHFIIVWIYSESFPSSFFWWLNFIAGLAITFICGEQLCQHAELQPITFGVGSISGGQGASSGASNGGASPAGRYKKRTSNIPADVVELVPLTAAGSSDRSH
ncbi:hypothetical protein SeMB42_g03701 [Synchytrium endobioticum]|uniref:Protein SYS1 n=1 Tax=Synchytrium endobioticum TaxID=286115 RepID=A0A507D533_9FUNG|nr:hypothetical protein SeMB42_g03701 [Synchytrium endobioticum]